jgi:hypothetical protein
MDRFVRIALLFVLLPFGTSLATIGNVTVSGAAPQAAEQLNIIVQPVSHLSGCVQMSVAARGDGIAMLINVTYASTGVVMSNGTVEVHVANAQLLRARFSAGSKLWTALYVIPWDHPAGPLDYFVTARSVDGAVGLWKPIRPYGLITIVPANLHVAASVVDEKTNAPVYSASWGTTVKIVASVALPLPGEGFPTHIPEEPSQVAGAGAVLNTTLASKVEAVVGQGMFNVTTGRFSNFTASTIPLSYDEASSMWVGSYTFKDGDPSGLYEVAVVAADKSSPPNTSFSLSNGVTLGAPTTGGIDSGTVYVVSFGMIIVGFVAGLVVISRFALPKRKGG